MPRRRIPERFQVWIEARKRHHLSHAQVQMARELGMNPTKLGKLDNHHQEAWKLPLPQFIEHLYSKRFGKERPAAVVSIEERFRRETAKRAAKQEAKRLRVKAEGGAMSDLRQRVCALAAQALKVVILGRDVPPRPCASRRWVPNSRSRTSSTSSWKRTAPAPTCTSCGCTASSAEAPRSASTTATPRRPRRGSAAS
jgi:hypothetical protein